MMKIDEIRNGSQVCGVHCGCPGRGVGDGMRYCLY